MPTEPPVHSPDVSVLLTLCDRSLDPLFWHAERVGTVSAWWAHVPFAQWLVVAAKPRLLVELGTHSGVSYSAFCSAVLRAHLGTSCFAVDTWEGDEHAGRYGEDVYWNFRAFHDERFAAFSNLLRTTFDEALFKFDDGSIDLLHIDGLHTYSAVKHDFEFWLPKLSRRGVVLFHDINERERDFGVWRLWDELKEQFPAFEFLHGHGLGVLAVGADVPTAVQMLCSVTDPAEIATLRERFAFLGERWVSEMRERVSAANVQSRAEARESETAERLRNEAESARREGEARTAAEKRAAALELSDARAKAEAERVRRIEVEARAKAEMEAAESKAEVTLARSRAAETQRALQAESERRRAVEASHRQVKATLNNLKSELDRAHSELDRVSRDRNAIVCSRAWRFAQRLEAMSRAKASRMLSKAAKSAWWTLTLQLPARLRRRREFREQAQLIRESGLFDADWYRQQYSDAAAADIDPAIHYLAVGAKDGRNPSRAFDGNWYVRTYPDVAAAGQNPLLHYLQSGREEGRQIQPLDAGPAPLDPELREQVQLISGSPLFDAAWYAHEYPDVASAGLEPATHYLLHGASEGRNPSPRFDGDAYLQRYPDVALNGFNPLVHYLLFGEPEGREIQAVGAGMPDTPEEQELRRQAELLAQSPLFDAAWYCNRYPDVTAANFDPVDHYVRFGASEKRNPGPLFDAAWYLDRYPDVAAVGLNPVVHYIEHGAAEHREIRPVPLSENVEIAPSAYDALEAQFPALVPLRTFLIPGSAPRLTIVTDSINAGFLYGGVGTALILSAMIAERIGASLRLITRSQSPDASNLADVLAANGIEWDGAVEFVHSPYFGAREIPISERDLFMTTSWWTTRSVLGAVIPSKIVYLLQEDERMFYPFGDERLRCAETLSSAGIRFVINSELLYRHLTTGPDALSSVRERGIWFEPAFPETNYYPEPRDTGAAAKHNFFFYARPQNLRNLYWRGLEAITAAIEENVLQPDEWEFHFVGRSLTNLVLPRGIKPKMQENLPWACYAALLRSMDLGLCLMDTPHPSYPPLDLAACGAVVVTNRHGLKASLSQYSENILCADPSVDGLKTALRAGAILACDDATRFANFSRNRLARDWKQALQSVVDELSQSLVREDR